MKKILYIILLSFIFSQECNDECACNYNPDSTYDTECDYNIDACGECGGNDFTDEGYSCHDLQILQDLIDANPSLGVSSPLELSYLDWGNDCNGECRFLEVLRIRNAGITSVPDNIWGFSQLKELDFAYNNIQGAFPEGSNDGNSDMYHLEILNLSDNSITWVSPAVHSGSNLTQLYLGNNQLNQIDSFCESEYMNDLEELEIRLYGNNLCEEYNLDCIDWFSSNGSEQDQSNCCQGPNGEDNWTKCPNEYFEFISPVSDDEPYSAHFSSHFCEENMLIQWSYQNNTSSEAVDIYYGKCHSRDQPFFNCEYAEIVSYTENDGEFEWLNPWLGYLDYDGSYYKLLIRNSNNHSEYDESFAISLCCPEDYDNDGSCDLNGEDSCVGVPGEVVDCVTECVMLGDSNGDGLIEEYDVVSILNFLLGNGTSSIAMDGNQDESIDLLDAVFVLANLYGLDLDNQNYQNESVNKINLYYDSISIDSDGYLAGAFLKLLCDDCEINLVDENDIFSTSYHMGGSDSSINIVVLYMLDDVSHNELISNISGEYIFDYDNSYLVDIDSVVSVELGYLLGDVNMDISINVQDVVRMVSLIFGSDYSSQYADMNTDNEINIFDVVLWVDFFFSL